MHEMIQPTGWQQPRGYTNGVAAQGKIVFVAGQIGWNESNEFVSDDFAAQAAQALRNVVAVVEAAGGSAQHIARMTWYVTDKREYIESMPEIGDAYRLIIGRNYPAMTLVQVVALLEDRAKVEIEATAVIP
ncbi:MAG: RidA family protein [Candidatus Eremiobacteraeota bacterium]|nr:RidA family protein [Candidatus Eremiobacteraeota bacterium]